MIGNQRPRTLVVGWPQWGRNGGSVNELLVRQKMFLWQMKLIVNNFSTRSVFILRSTKKQYKVDQQLLLSIFFFFKFNCPKYYPKKKKKSKCLVAFLRNLRNGERRRFKGRKKREEEAEIDVEGLRLSAVVLCLCFNSFDILFVIFFKGF